MHLQPMSVGFEPAPHFRILMVGGVVLNHDGPLTAISPGQLLEEAEIGVGVEDGVLPIVEPSAPEFNGSQNLHAFAFPGNRDFRRAAYAAPGSVQSRVLPETGFVGEDQRRVLRAGFFLRFG
jgi:hypothetical protein